MNSQTREAMSDACTRLRQVRDNLESAAKNITDQNMKNTVTNQLNAVNACLKECEHIWGNVSQI